MLTKWFGASRWTYNQCVHGVEEEQVARNKKTLRDYCINDTPHLRQKAPWVFEVPYDIRNEAMCDVLKAYSTNFALLKTKHMKHFTMKQRCLKDASTSIVIHSKHWKDTSQIFYSAFFKKAGAELTLCSSESIPEKIEYDCRLQRTRLGHYYFCLLLPATPSENQARLAQEGEEEEEEEEEAKILAIDPGVRTFMTGYEPATGRYVEWGKGDMKRIERLLVHLDDLVSRTAQSENRRQRFAMRKAQMRMRLRVRHLIDEFHKKLVSWLTQSYALVLWPSFETSRMTNTTTRKISRPSVRAMLTWSHYRFKERLLAKSKRTPSCTVVIVDEHHTTMTCGECGYLNRAVGASKVFHCPLCQTTLPRDWNAARNIFLRHVSKTSALQGTQSLGLHPTRRKSDATTDGSVI